MSTAFTLPDFVEKQELPKVKGRWSFSALMQFEQCPYKYFVEQRLGHRGSSGPAAERGSKIHDECEHYITMVSNDTPSDKKVAAWIPELEELRGMYADGQNLICEDEWAFDRDWGRVAWGSPDAWLRGKLDVFVKEGTSAHIMDWKGLPINTPIPTPKGWSTIGELAVGDKVFGSDGKAYNIYGKSKEKNLHCYQIKFDDKTEITCDEEHLWKTTNSDCVPVTELKIKDKIPLTAPVDYPPKVLPVDPYVLGLWLADGKHTSGEITKEDDFVFKQCEKRGYKVSHDYSKKANNGKTQTRTIIGLRKQLIALGVLGNKHIPSSYMEASIDQRLDLLRGLMDGDGNANPTRKQAVFTTIDKPLSDKVKMLVESLGNRVNQSVVKYKGFGVTGIAYPLAWRPFNFNPFLMPRKATQLKVDKGGRRYRQITEINYLPKQQTQCIAVSSPDETFLCGKNYLVTHNTGRKFGNEMKHQQQGILYAIMAFMIYPELEFARVEFLYLDQPYRTNLEQTYTRDQALMFLPNFEKRVHKMLTSEIKAFAPPLTLDGLPGYLQDWLKDPANHDHENNPFTTPFYVSNVE